MSEITHLAVFQKAEWRNYMKHVRNDVLAIWAVQCTSHINTRKKPSQTEFIPVTVPRPKQSTACTFDHALHSRARINNHNEEIRYREISTAQFFRHFQVSIIRGVKMMTFGSESSACFS